MSTTIPDRLELDAAAETRRIAEALRMLQAPNAGRDAAAVAAELGYRPEQIERAYREIDHKRAVTRPLHLTSLLVAPVPDVGGSA